VGSGYGFFLDDARKTGYKTYGIEPSQFLCTYTKKKYHIPAFIGELEDYKDKNKYDIVTCIHVIEHVRNPKKFIFLLLQLVVPGGILYIETPNSDSHLLNVEKEDYTFLIPPDHLWLFSYKSIQYLLPKNTEMIHKDTYSYSEHFMGIVKKVIKGKMPTYLDEEKRNDLSTPLVSNGRQNKKIKERLSYLFFDRTLAPLCTSLLNINHKGSILEVYIKKKI
jgi:SAM-dependent methyltransferase